jgi:hypothetical protein
MITAVGLVLFGLCTLYILGTVRQRRIDRFRSEATTGYLCRFYHSGEQIEGRIIGSGVNDVVIESDRGIHKRFRADIYPW